MKHISTPAPWGAEFSASERCWQIVHLPSDDVLCLVNTDIESNLAEHDGQANAQLIAAAPGLLEACERAANEGCNMEDGYRISRSTLELLVGVIDRAKGETS